MKNFFAYTSCVLGILQLVLVLASWLITAAMPEWGLHSLLSAEGVRWYFGDVVSNMSSTLLVDILLLSSAFGAVYKTGLSAVFRQQLSYRQRVALRFVVGELVLSVVIMLLLTMIPHAILLSITGHLFPSSFSRSLVPVITFTLWVMSETYILISGTNQQTIPGIFDDLTYGIHRCVPLIFCYLVGIQLYESILFVM